ncbi:MAG TPA: MoxR family ATPase [Candidatus Thermoplasmatota archaeon]|nr:MoxR family ATPase [Candidatus Thermoplasmatota archaeon]
MATKPQAAKTFAQARPQRPPNPNVVRLADTTKRLIDEVAKVIVGKREVLELVTINILSSGNILFEDFPGMAKTLMANTFARAAGCDFRRIQFTPDVLPGDITGTYVYNQQSSEFNFRPGPVFTNILLADEINRAPPKTQSALLEAMQERQVTVEGATLKLDKPYLVMATQNPVEQEGTYPLPEAQMDRFLMKLSVGYPAKADEAEILRRRIRRAKDDVDVSAVTNPQQVIAMQQTIETIYISDEMIDYIADLVVRTRGHPDIYVGSSPRGSQALLKACRSKAAMSGRDFVVPDDVKFVAPHILAHRIILRPESKIRGVKNHDVVNEIVREAPVPTV